MLLKLLTTDQAASDQLTIPLNKLPCTNRVSSAGKKTMPFLPLLREICSFEGQEKVDHL
jgi:hypothetical protein